jgi:hypothetical protein
MKEDARPQINASRMVIGGGVAAAIFTVGSMLIFITGLPVLRYMFPAAIVLGCVFALALRFVRHRTPGTPWLISAIEKDVKHLPEQEAKEKAGPFAKVVSRFSVLDLPRLDSLWRDTKLSRS